MVNGIAKSLPGKTFLLLHLYIKKKHATHPLRAKSTYKWRTILETSDAVIQNLQESRSKANFCNKKREKAKRLHRLKIQTEGHTQSGLVHLTVVITWCSRDCSASTLKAASYDPASMTLPAQTSSSHRFQVLSEGSWQACVYVSGPLHSHPPHTVIAGWPLGSEIPFSWNPLRLLN